MKLKHLLLLTILAIASSCSSDNDDSGIPSNDKGWIYKTMQANYLWSNNLPSYNNTNSGGSVEDFYESIRYRHDRSVQLSLDYYGDRFSGVSSKSSGTRSASAIQEYGLGMQMIVASTQSNTHDLYVYKVIPGSPAANAGLKRGDKFSKLVDNANGMEIGFPYSSSQEAIIIQILEKGNITLTISRQGEQQEQTYVIQNAIYTATPVLNRTKIDDTGYIAYDYFPIGLSSSAAGQYNYSVLKEAFNYFAAEGGIRYLIVDLRDNGGGGLDAAQQFASFIAPRSNLSDIFTKLQYNNGNFENIRFLYSNEISNLNPNLEKVYFICNYASASASEMLMHCLKPYFGENCKFIGAKTYGKNVGGSVYESSKYNWEINLISIRVHDKNGVSGYEEGIAVDYTQHETLPLYPLGDPKEALLARALNVMHGTPMPTRRSAQEIDCKIIGPKLERPQDLILGTKTIPEEYYKEEL